MDKSLTNTMLRSLVAKVGQSGLLVTQRGVAGSIYPTFDIYCQPRRSFAKKAKKSGGGKKSRDPGAAGANDSESEEVVDILNLTNEMDKSIQFFQTELSNLRTGRADPSMLDHLKVDAYGSMVSLKEVGHVALRGPRTLNITVFDPSLAKAVMTSVTDSPLEFNPILDGHSVNIHVPKMTQETREKMAKQANKLAEKAKQSIRSVRKQGMDQVKAAKSNSSLPEDEVVKHSDQVQKLTDERVATIAKLLESKSRDITADGGDDDDE